MNFDEASSGKPLRASDASRTPPNSIKRSVRPIADMPSPTSLHEEGEVEGKGHFFGLHFPTFEKACQLGINHAVAYLVLARGTQADNRTTTWSTNSVEQYSRISRDKARACINELIAENLLENVGGTKHRPVRTLFPPPEPKLANSAGDVLDDDYEAVMRNLPIRKSGVTKGDAARFAYLAKGGWVEERDGWWCDAEGIQIVRPRAELVWLPNSLIDGIDGRNPPVEILRQTQSIWTLCLLVALYKNHALTFSQGLPHEIYCETYSREKLTEFREFDLFQFEPKHPQVAPDTELVTIFENSDSERAATDQFWEGMDLLKRLGLVSIIPHLFDGPEGEVVYPLAEPRDGADATQAEGELFVTIDAACRALTGDQASVPRAANAPIRVLVQNHMRKAQVRGIARMRHRPRTMVTAKWFAQSSRWREWTQLFHNLQSEIRRTHRPA